MFNTIKAKLIGIGTVIILFVALLIGSVSLYTINRITVGNAVENINKVADFNADSLNRMFSQCEDAIDFAGKYIEKYSDGEMFKSKEHRQEITTDILTGMKSTLFSHKSVSGYYIVFPDDITGDGINTIYRRRGADFTSYDEKGVYSMVASLMNYGHGASWALGNARGVWTEPHYDRSRRRNVISYLKPIFHGDKMVAIAGVDLSVETILDRTISMDIYKTEQIFLADKMNTEHYHTWNVAGVTADHNGVQENGTATLAVNNGKILHVYKRGETDYARVTKDLKIGMDLMVSVNVDEIYKERNNMMVIIISFMIFVVLLAVGFLWTNIHHLTDRINKLADVSERFVRGEVTALDEMERTGDDEIARLSRIMNASFYTLRGYMDNMERLSYTDGLTGLHNRMGMDKFIPEWMDAGKFDTMAMAAIDLDNFKTINDTYGHAAGDKALITLSMNLQNFYRDTNALVGRNGGDEFLILIKDADPQWLEENMRQLHEMDQSFEFDGHTISFTLSIGYSTYPFQASNLKELQRQSDEALYAVKLTGRNNYMRYDESCSELRQKMADKKDDVR